MSLLPGRCPNAVVVFSMLASFCAANCRADSPAESLRATQDSGFSHKIVFRQDGRFGGWPANNGAWAWGDEFLVGFSAAWHKEQDAKRHQIDYDKPEDAWFARSLDGGRSWSIERPSTIWGADEAVARLRPLDEAVDFSRPGFAMTLRFHKSGPAYFFYTYDKGKTWRGPYEFPKLGTSGINARTDYIVHGSREMTAFLTAQKANGKEGRPICVRTTDGGMTWSLLSHIGPEPANFSIMPSTVQLDPESFLTTLRVKQDEERSCIEAWISRDRGVTWSWLGTPVPAAGGQSGNPPDLIRLRDGRLCLVYGYRSVPRGIRARISADEGRSWGEELVLRDDAVSHDLGYSRSFEREDGMIVSVYYYNDGIHNERFIAATTWSPVRS